MLDDEKILKETLLYKKLSDNDFIRIISAACVLGDGRRIHIEAYKRLLNIIEKNKTFGQNLTEAFTDNVKKRKR